MRKMACRAEASGLVNLKTLVLNLPLFPEVPLCEGMTGTGFQIPLEMLSLFNRLECDVKLDLPRRKLGGVRALSRVMVCQSLPEICGMTNVTLVRMAQTFDHVCVEHGLPSIARNPSDEKSSFA
jgi:hypothetical protein